MFGSTFYFILTLNFVIITRFYTENFDPYAISSLITSGLAMLGWLQTVYFAWKLGTSDFSKCRLDGPYEVGVRYARTNVLGNEISIFYPVEGGADFKRRLILNPSLNAPVHQDPEKGIAEQINLIKTMSRGE